ncbi:hypothetical protein ACFLSE_08405 [Bacteroidota bacterium]
MNKLTLFIICLTSFSQIAIGQLNPDNLKVVENVHYFSNQQEKDTFRLTLTGNSFIEGQINFEIINSKGKRIYHETFKSKFLIGYGLMEFEKPTVSEKTNYIAKRMEEFFNESNFIEPAIPKKEQFDEDNYKKESFYKIQKNEKSIGFSYVIGEENIRSITVVDGKVIVFFNCC